MAWFSVRSENLARVVRVDLVLVAVRGDDGDVAPPLLGAGRISGLLTEHAHPRGTFPDRRVGEFADTSADQHGGIVQVGGYRPVAVGVSCHAWA
jgi:hypothetical protein